MLLLTNLYKLTKFWWYSSLGSTTLATVKYVLKRTAILKSTFPCPPFLESQSAVYLDGSDIGIFFRNYEDICSSTVYMKVPLNRLKQH